MDTFVDSSWYFLRYLDPQNRKEMFDRDKAFKMTPVDLYIGGKEHGIYLLVFKKNVFYIWNIFQPFFTYITLDS